MQLQSEVPSPLKNLVLVGFMGCGKSAISRRLGEKLNYPVFDTDDMVEERSGRKISEIFEQDGEDAFRRLETETLSSLLDTGEKKRIIATGGGVVTRPENDHILKELGFVVWLDARPDTVIKRISKGTDRPLLNTDDPEEAIRRLSAERRPLYEKASHMRMETDGLTFDEIVLGIVETARYYFGTQ